jgi:hypothetical protein
MVQPVQVFEIFQKIELETSRPKRLKLMQQYSDVPAFKDILRGMFDDTLEFLLPEGKPPYTPNIPESIPSTLLKKHRDFGYFVKGGPGTNLPAYKRERMFIELLESVHPDDALLVLAMVGKKPPFKGLTKKLVKEAFPNLIQT